MEDGWRMGGGWMEDGWRMDGGALKLEITEITSHGSHVQVHGGACADAWRSMCRYMDVHCGAGRGAWRYMCRFMEVHGGAWGVH